VSTWSSQLSVDDVLTVSIVDFTGSAGDVTFARRRLG
jgi:hypothetical protein